MCDSNDNLRIYIRDAEQALLKATDSLVILALRRARRTYRRRLFSRLRFELNWLTCQAGRLDCEPWLEQIEFRREEVQSELQALKASR